MRIFVAGLCIVMAGCGNDEEMPPPPAARFEVPPPPVAPPPPITLSECESAVECAKAEQAERQVRAEEFAERRAEDRKRAEKQLIVPFAQRKQPEMLKLRGTGWINELQPTRNGVCTFTERPAGSKPADYVRTAWSGNIDLWDDYETLLHDHAIGFVESTFAKAKPVVAVRDGLPDLWIEPQIRSPDEPIVLYIGPDRFECVRHRQP